MCLLHKDSQFYSLSFSEVLLFCLQLEQFEQDFLFPLLIEKSFNSFPLVTNRKLYSLGKGYRIRLVILRMCFFYLRSKNFSTQTLRLDCVYSKNCCFALLNENLFDFADLNLIDLVTHLSMRAHLKTKTLYPYLYTSALLSKDYQLAKILFSVNTLIQQTKRVLYEY